MLRYGDPARQNDAGALWVWGKRGRPLAMAEIFHSDNDNGVWGHAMSLTSTELLRADTDAGEWAPRKAPFALQAFAGAGPPSDKAPLRLRQMKAIARRHAAHEFWEPDNSRYELRLLLTPLYRYRDEEAGLVDGAVFAFTHGTNPEILMFVEARAEEGRAASWYLGFARLGSAELVVTLDRETVWRQPRAPGVVGRPSEAFWLFIVPASTPPSARGKETTE